MASSNNVFDLLDGNDSIIRSTQMVVQNHLVYLDEPISDPRRYRDVISCLVTAGEQDFINILVNSEGGRLDSALSIIEAMQSCPASLIVTVTGSAYSAASMIACMAPECFITDAAEFMVHTAHYGSGGTVPNVKAHTDFTTGQINALIDKIYTGFLTAKEIEEVKKGREFWFDAPEARKRMEHRMNYVKKKLEKDVKQQVKELKRLKRTPKQNG